MVNNITFTPEEKELIKYVFNSNRRFYKAFVDETIASYNINNLVWAINDAHQKRGNISQAQHPIMEGLFAKVGLWKDGTTTIEEHDRQLADALERERENRRLAIERDKKKLAEQITRLEKIYHEIDKSDEEIEAELTAIELEKTAALKVEMRVLRQRKQKHAESKREDYLAELGIDVRTIAPPKRQLPVPPPQVPPEHDDPPVEAIVRADLEAMKKDELVAVAGEMGIEVPSKIKKAALIEKILQ